MSPTVSKALQAIAVYVLGILCPGVPAWLWMAIVAAIFSGDITPAHIIAFAASHNIKTEPDYNIQKNGGKTIQPAAVGQANGNFNRVGL
jgi:hypothetical protein